ncbi:hypothetical protein LTR37_016170 [Vermiconidia calcicola]|uniref:Uncharacterized protein n=1 Tax=Vermiconidia calcicola TaxID=1690605 RepID=A0ACC3MNM3_9PEZI|nr:hypothetical protein LTR37_016170 [Vermiconidia calcicola]
MLSAQGRLPISACLYYQDAAYKALLPEIKQKAFEAPYLAAVLMLRITLELTGTDQPQPDTITFLGLEVFIDALRANPQSSLHAAIVMAMLRLYLHLALMHGKPLDLLESSCEWLCHDFVVPDDSRGWEWKALIQCARLANYTYGPKPKTMESWKMLEGFGTTWEAGRPVQFDPMFESNGARDGPFPKIMFSHDIHGAYLEGSYEEIMHVSH